MSSDVPIELGGPVYKSFAPELDGAAGSLLDGSPELLGGLSGQERIAAARLDPDTDLLGAMRDGELVAVYLLRRAHLMNELDLLVVSEAHRNQGYGKAALADAVRRSGRRPLALECSDALRPYFLQNGYKIVGKRVGPNGEPRFRLGAHAPRPKTLTPNPSPNSGRGE